MLIGSTMSFDSGLTRSRMKAMKQLKQTNAEQLETETRKMEERIRSLKEQMVREKEEREKCGGIRWASGHSGPLNTHAQQVLKKKSTKPDKQTPRKIKLLTDEPLKSYTKKASPRDALRESGGGHGTVHTCGQCDKSRATLACVECGENYCVSCFMGFHQKGALKKHKTRPVDQPEKEVKEEKKRPVPPRVTRVTNSSSDRPPLQNGDVTQKKGGALLRGAFDEDESAASFAEALKEWRNTKENKEDQVWVNPADTGKGTSCGTSTVSEAPKQTVEIKVNFGPNKSLNYLDRLLLKKHREDPTEFSKKHRPTSLASDKKESKDETRRVQNDYSLNYREIFQSLGNHTLASKAARQSISQDHERNSGVVLIEEVTDDCANTEETTACFVQEEGALSQAVSPVNRPCSRSGRVSIMAMTPSGEFQEETDTLVQEDVLSSSSNSPVLESTSRTKVERIPSRPKPDKGTGNSVWTEQQGARHQRVWSPQPSYAGLSDFFLAGVKTESAPSESVPREGTYEASMRSKPLLSRGVWKPLESISITEVDESRDQAPSNGSPRWGGQSPVRVVPLVQEPTVDIQTNIAKRSDRASEDSLQTSQEWSDSVNMPRIHDFGIVDFLKAAPELPKDDFGAVHRVSTVSPLSLTPKPPQLHWSDDDSDDDVITLVRAHAPGYFDEGDQGADDQATLDDLTWELASTTGRLTQCENLDEMEGGEGEESYEEDSIEENDCGSGLSSPDELDADVEDRTLCDLSTLEDQKLQSEVRALR